jgi:hypothetical protein
MPSADAYVSNEYPNSNYGDEDKLFVHAGSNTKRSFLRFDLPVLAQNEVITGAALHLFFGQGGNAGTIIDLHHVSTDDWSENAITWANKPAHEAAPLTSATTLLGNAEMTWNLPVTLFASDTDGRISLLLKLADETDNDTATFFSKEAAINPAVPPYLFLHTAPVPEPETWAMLLAGLGCLGWAARKRNSQSGRS